MLPTDTPTHDWSRAYAAGYRATMADARPRVPSWPQRHRLLTVALVIAALGFLARLHPGAVLVGLGVVVLVSPVLLAGLVVELVVRQHRRWRTGWRTLTISLSWLAGFGLFLLAVVVGNVLPVVLVLAGIVAWTVEGRRRGRQETGARSFPPGPGHSV